MRGVVFIDGSNFYFKLKQLTASEAENHHGKHFDFRKFAEWLASSNELVGIRYYIGAVKREPSNEKSQRLYSDQQRLIGRLQVQDVDVVLGHVIRHPDRTYHEKGVDVRLAVRVRIATTRPTW